MIFTVPCGNGTYSVDGIICEMCKIDEYQDMSGQISCKSCPAEKFNENNGSKTEADCKCKSLLARIY